MKNLYLKKDEFPINRLPKSAKSNLHLGPYTPHIVQILMHIEDGADPWILLDNLIVANSMLEKAIEESGNILSMTRSKASAVLGECLDETSYQTPNKESVNKPEEIIAVDQSAGKSASEEKNELDKPESKMDLLESHTQKSVIDANKRLFEHAEPLEIAATLSELYQAYVLEVSRKGIYLPAHFDAIGKHMKLITEFLRDMHPLGEEDLSDED